MGNTPNPNKVNNNDNWCNLTLKQYNFMTDMSVKCPSSFVILFFYNWLVELKKMENSDIDWFLLQLFWPSKQVFEFETSIPQSFNMQLSTIIHWCLDMISVYWIPTCNFIHRNCYRLEFNETVHSEPFYRNLVFPCNCMVTDL